MRTLCVAIVLGSLGASALAECPQSPADLTAGITVSFEDGSVTQLRRDADGMVVEHTEYNSGEGSGFYARSKFGFAYVESGETINGEIVGDTRTAYDYGAGGLDLITTPDSETTRFTVERTVSYDDGSKQVERITFRSREFGQRTWGDCSYRVLPIEVSVSGSNDGRSQTFAYITELGVSVYVGVTEWDEPVSVWEPIKLVRGLTAAD